MAKKESTPTPPDGTEPIVPPSRPLPIIPLLNTVAIVAALGLFYYSKYLFKRPPITEKGERSRLAEAHASPTPPPVPAFVTFDPVTINIKASPEKPLPGDGTPRQIQGKLHYATVAFSLEIRDSEQKEVVDAVRPLIQDKLIQTLGKKNFHELTTVQGRYILHSQIMDFSNQLIVSHSAKPMKEGLVTNVFFTQFIVQ